MWRSSLHTRSSVCSWDNRPFVAWGATVTLFSKRLRPSVVESFHRGDGTTPPPFYKDTQLEQQISEPLSQSALCGCWTPVEMSLKLSVRCVCTWTEPCKWFIFIQPSQILSWNTEQFPSESSFRLIPLKLAEEAVPPHLPFVPQCLAFLSLLTRCVSSLLLLAWQSRVAVTALTSVAGMLLAAGHCHKDEIRLKTSRPPSQQQGYVGI